MTDDDTEESVAVCFEFGKSLGTEISYLIFDGDNNIRVHALINVLDEMSHPDAALAGLLATFIQIMQNQHQMIIHEYVPEALTLH
jgi:hypothetical protein